MLYSVELRSHLRGAKIGEMNFAPNTKNKFFFNQGTINKNYSPSLRICSLTALFFISAFLAWEAERAFAFVVFDFSRSDALGASRLLRVRGTTARITHVVYRGRICLSIRTPPLMSDTNGCAPHLAGRGMIARCFRVLVF